MDRLYRRDGSASPNGDVEPNCGIGPVRSQNKRHDAAGYVALMTMPMPSVREGAIEFAGFPVWFRIVGAEDSPMPPLLCLHGGSGAASDYLEPFGDRAATGREVVFYDQLGCGNSGIVSPHDP